MKVIGYIRVSTQEQDQSGLGLADQESKIKSYCDLYNLELTEIEKDAASGKNLDRPGLRRALAKLKKGEVEGVIVAKLDRLTRSVKDMGILLEKYFQAKFSLFVVSEQIDTRTAAGRLVLNMLITVAQWERETIGERTKAALNQKRARGEFTGGHVPYGYRQENGKLIVDKAEKATLAKMKKWRAQGVRLRAICDRLNEAAIPTRAGGAWKPGTVDKLIKTAA